MDEQREQSMRRANFVSDVAQDLAFTLRTLRRNVGFTFLVVGALAIGIGANTAIFGMIDAVFVRGLPVPHPEAFVAVGDPTRVNSYSSGSPRTDLLSAPVYRAVRDNNTVFTGVLASGKTDRLDVRVGGGELEHPRGRFVSGELLLRARHLGLDRKSVRRQRGFDHRRRRAARDQLRILAAALSWRSRRHRPEHHGRRRALHHRRRRARVVHRRHRRATGRPLDSAGDARRDAPALAGAARPVHELAVAARPPQAGRHDGTGASRAGAARREEHSRERQCEGRLGVERLASQDVRVLGRQGFFQSP